jgi:phosphonopyruvate decarboxylase
VTLGGTGLPPRRGISMMQNSGLGNAVSPLTSLTWTFRLPQLLIVTWRGQPGVADEPQHALMGPITPQLLELMQIPWELFPVRREEIAPALERATRHMDSSGQPYALLMQKGTVAPCDLQTDPLSVARPPSHAPLVDAAAPPRSLVSREQALTQVLACTTDAATVVLASTGFCGRELFALQDRPSHFYMVGSMGCVSAIALGLALSRPDLRVVALDGDGAALMRMGTFATIGAYAPPNLWHLLLDNAVHDSTGGQSTVSRRISFAGIAAACGYASALQTAELGKIAAWLEAGPLTGPRFACLLTRPGSPADLPRPTLGPVAVKERLRRHIGARLDP